MFEKLVEKKTFFPFALTIIFVANFFLKMRQLICREYFWVDELKLSLNILERSYFQFFQVLDQHQVAPPFFMMITKFFVSLLGSNEWAFRFLPFLASVLSPVIFYLVLRKAVSSLFLSFVFLLFCLSPTLTIYASEFKPYATDVLCCLLMYLAFISYRNSLSSPMLLLKIAFLAVLPFLSIPSFFILVGLSGAEIFSKSTDRRRVLLFFAGIIFWCLCYFNFYHEAKHAAFMEAFWANRVATLNDSWPNVLTKLGSVIANILSEGMALGRFWMLGGVMILLGMINLFLKRTYIALALYLPFCVVFIFSLLNKYPFYLRLVLFLLPAFYVALVTGLNTLYRQKNMALKFIGIALGLLLIFLPIRESLANWKTPYQKTATKSLFAFIENSVGVADAIYFHYRSHSIVQYYGKNLLEKYSGSVMGKRFSVEEGEVLDEVKRIPKRDKTWIVFTQMYARPHHIQQKEAIIKALGEEASCKLKFNEITESVYLCEKKARNL